MVSDKQIEANHRKHRRSPSLSNEADKHLKRHKHRHHKHHLHRHHRDKKHDDEVQDGDYETLRGDASPSLKDAAGDINGGEIDLEEGEVLEEEGIGEILKKKLESDGEAGEIKSGQFRDNSLPLYIDTLPDDGLADDRPKEKTFRCGLTRESERGDGYPSEKNVKKNYGNGRRSFPFENSEDKHKISTRSPSITRHTGDVHAQNRSRSRDRERERSRSRSRSAMEEEPTVRGRHRGSSRDHDRDRRRERERDYLRDRDNDRGRSGDKARYSSRERGREYERERRSEKDGNRGREIPSDWEKHKSRDDGYGEVRHKRSGHSRHDEEDDLEIRSSNSIKGHNPKVGNSKENGGNVERSRNDDDQNDNGEVVVWDLAEQEDKESKIIEESRKRALAILEKYKKKSEQQNGISLHDKGKDLELEAIPKQSSNVVDVGTLGHAASAVDQAKSAIDGDGAKLSSTVGDLPARLLISDSDRTLAPAGLGEGSPKGERSDDMFNDDIFGESPAGTRKTGNLRGKGDGLPIVRSGLHDNWDDAEGYYSYQIGELIDGRYEILATHGKGVFSTVVRAKDTKAEPGAESEEVAIKIIRNNETMHKAGQTEVQILKKLCGSDPEDRHHCVRFLSSFKYRNHLCLVFESLHLNLREVLKKFGRNIGLNILGVRTYAMQLFTSLKHLKNCGVLHCDIKPDNMLVNKETTMLKLSDFGSAMFAGKNEVTPYLASRFYRAPEIILGLCYDHPLDMWSVGCCLYELYSGKVLFPGSTNNDMLRLHMELKGPFPKKMLRKGAFIDQHFDKDLSFYATEEDSVSGKTIKRMMVNIKRKDFGSVIKSESSEDRKVLLHFRDLLEKIFILDPGKRLTVSQALAHPFITSK